MEMRVLLLKVNVILTVRVTVVVMDALAYALGSARLMILRANPVIFINSGGK